MQSIRVLCNFVGCSLLYFSSSFPERELFSAQGRTRSVHPGDGRAFHHYPGSSLALASLGYEENAYSVHCFELCSHCDAKRCFDSHAFFVPCKGTLPSRGSHAQRAPWGAPGTRSIITQGARYRSRPWAMKRTPTAFTASNSILVATSNFVWYLALFFVPCKGTLLSPGSHAKRAPWGRTRVQSITQGARYRSRPWAMKRTPSALIATSSVLIATPNLAPCHHTPSHGELATIFEALEKIIRWNRISCVRVKIASRV